MKLNWFSPLAPAKTEIAHYTSRTVAALRELVEVTLWTDQPHWDPALEKLGKVRRYDGQYPDAAPWHALHEADLSVYHIGNNPLYHGGIWQVSQRLPGLVVLHDDHLHDLFFCLYRDWKFQEGYVARMASDYGEAGYAAAQQFCKGELHKDFMAENFPLTALAVEHAAGVLVHTPGAFTQVKKVYHGSLLQTNLPHPTTPGTRQPVRSERPPYQLVVFGYISRNRRLDSLFQALACYPRKDAFRLDIYGSLWDPDYVRAQIEALRLEPLVTLHGFVPEAELDTALGLAHLAVNLRYPTMGEASACQLRIWYHALPSLVTAVGWYATLPERSVGFVHPHQEIADIHAHLDAFLASPSSYARQGQEGRHILEACHAPAAYAQCMLEFAESLLASPARRVTHYFASRVGAELSTWMPGSSKAAGYGKVAEAIHRLVA